METTFSISSPESLLFAACSGDFNPLHIDPVFADQTLYGGTVVHGIHAFLRAIDPLFDAMGKPGGFRSLRLRFHRPIPTDAPVTSVYSVVGAKYSLDLFCACQLTQKHTFELADNVEDRRGPGCPPVFRREPAELSLEECGDTAGSTGTGFDGDIAKHLLPGASRWLQPAQLGTVLALSRIAGMECPGLHSLLFKCEGEFVPNASDSDLSFRTVETDERFPMVYIDVNSQAFRGRIQAIFREDAGTRS